MNVRNRRIIILLNTVLVLGVVGAKPCLAGVVYSNLGPGNTWIVNRDYQASFDFAATPFVTTAGGNLGDILVPIFSLSSPATFGLYNTDSAGKPGSLLESWSAVVPGFPGVLTTLTSVQNPLLSADTQYWFEITLTSAQQRQLAWYQNNQEIDGGVWAGNSLDSLIDFEGGSPAPAIQLNSISVSTVPEPANELLLGAGLLILGLARMKIEDRSWVDPAETREKQ